MSGYDRRGGGSRGGGGGGFGDRGDRGGGYGSRGGDRGDRGYGDRGGGGYNDRGGDGYNDRGGGGYNDRGGGGYNDRGSRGGDRGGGSDRGSVMPSDYGGRDRGGGGGGGRKGGGKGGGRDLEIEDGVERGLVATMKDSFGFIKCETRMEELFFHFTDVRDSSGVRPGDCVEFRVGTDRRSRKVNALEIQVLPAGSVVLEEHLEGPFQGVVKKEPSGRGRPQDQSGGIITMMNDNTGEEEAISFKIGDVEERRSLRRGDDVEFAMVLDKRLKKKRAVKVKMGMPSGEGREQGIVGTLKDSFGFIDCADRDARLFFHFSEMLDRSAQVRQGDEVEFNVASSDRSGQENATKVVFLPQGTVFFEIEMEGRVRGVVSKELASKAQPRRDRNSRDRGGPQERSEPTGCIFVTKEAEEASEAATEPEAAPVCETSGAEAEAEAEAGVEGKVQRSTRAKKGPKKPEGETYEFNASDVGTTQIPLIGGDEVEFSLLKDKRTKKVRAIKIALVRLNPSRERGIVAAIKEPFVYVRREENAAGLVFHMNSLNDPRHKACIKDEVEFTTTTNRGGAGAVRVDILPVGSVALDDELEGRYQGEIKQNLKETPLLPGRWSDLRGGIVEVSSGLDGSEGPVEVGFDFSSMQGGNQTVDPDKLGEGDILEFSVSKEKLTQKYIASDVKLISFNTAKREMGIVSSLRDNFGFIKCAERESTIFFHFSQQLDRRSPKMGDEVAFDIATGENGKDNATRVEFLPKGTVVFEDLVEGQFEGVVTQEAQRRGHDTTNGIIEAAEAIETPEQLGARSVPASARSIRSPPPTPPVTSAQPTDVPPSGNLDEMGSEDCPPTAAAPAGDSADGANTTAVESTEEAAPEELCAEQPAMALLFRPESVQDRAVLRAGDRVQFCVAVERRTKYLVAKKVVAPLRTGVVRNPLRGRQGTIMESDDSRATFFADDVVDGVELNQGDEVEYVLTFDTKQKSLTAKKIKRTKEASKRPKLNMTMKKQAVIIVTAKGPPRDGTIGFCAGRGRPLAPQAESPAADPEQEAPPAEEVSGQFDDVEASAEE